MRFTAIIALAVAASAVNLKTFSKKGHGAKPKLADDVEEPDNTEDAKPTAGYQAKDKTTDKMWADLEAADMDDEE